MQMDADTKPFSASAFIRVHLRLNSVQQCRALFICPTVVSLLNIQGFKREDPEREIAGVMFDQEPT
jgi:hypothetical protein